MLDSPEPYVKEFPSEKECVSYQETHEIRLRKILPVEQAFCEQGVINGNQLILTPAQKSWI